MKHDKQHYIDMPLAKQHGYAWVYCEDGLHHYQKPVTYTPTLTQEQLDAGYRPVSEQRYAVVRATEDDIENGNLEFFLTRGYTR